MRDELILECRDIVKNLVKKYNNHRLDEDLVSTGMVEVVKCVDKCIQDGLAEPSQIKARCNTWARNAILNEIYKEKIKFVEDDGVLDTIKSEDDLWETIQVVKSLLTPRGNEILDLMLEGYSQKEIMVKLNVAEPTYFNHLVKIKEKIKSLPGSKE
jgi:RNA polymerase sigma factor (sigma-70 family)